MDFSKQLNKAEEAMRRRNYDFAAELYRQLVDIEPDLGPARAGLRQAQKKRAERKKRGLFGKAAGSVPLGRAKTMAKVKKYDAAAKALEDYLAGNPTDEDGNLMLGEVLEAAGHDRSAFAVYAFLAEVAPGNVEGLKRAGALAARTGDVPGALDFYEKALSADPRDQEAIKARKNLAAEAAIHQSRLDEVGHSREAVRDQAQTARLERNQRRHRTPEDIRAEIAELEDRLADSPSDPDLMIDLGKHYGELRDWPAALEFLERAAQYRRDDFDLACQVGDARAKVLKKRIARADKEGRRDEADQLEAELMELEIEEFRRRAERRPGDMQLRLDLGRRLLKKGDVDGALAEFQRVIADVRLGNEARFHMAACFQKKGILDLARKEYNEALDACRGVDDRAKEILYNLGLISEAEGDREGARGAYIRIYEVDIGYRDVAEKMEQLS
mgnify:CR=1 FL=1